ncbi:MAG: hypothetical protein RLZZ292_3352 [Bacteroidota bacterium]|jgi:hypothetical protein
MEILIILSIAVVLTISLTKYDGDRGGAQEDDRMGGYTNGLANL